MNITKKNKENQGVEERDSQSIEVLAQNVLDNKKRIEDQKWAIHFKIDELKKEKDKPTHVKPNALNSFAIEDIEKSTEPVENKEEIARKIAALMDAKDMCIYNDGQFMNSIKEYLKGIRPEIERIDKKQWELIKVKHEVEAEYNNTMNEIMTSYNALDKDIQKMLKIADIGYPRVGYEKRITPGNCWANQIYDVTHLVDTFLNTSDANLFSRIK